MQRCILRTALHHTSLPGITNTIHLYSSPLHHCTFDRRLPWFILYSRWWTQHHKSSSSNIIDYSCYFCVMARVVSSNEAGDALRSKHNDETRIWRPGSVSHCIISRVDTWTLTASGKGAVRKTRGAMHNSRNVLLPLNTWREKRKSREGEREEKSR